MTDCYAGNEAHAAGAKQKCLAHLARTARDWQKLTEEGSLDFVFFEHVKQFVKRGCDLHRLRYEGKLSDEEQTAEKAWLREELLRLEVSGVCRGGSSFAAQPNHVNAYRSFKLGPPGTLFQSRQWN